MINLKVICKSANICLSFICAFDFQRDPFPGDAPIAGAKIAKYKRGDEMISVSCTWIPDNDWKENL